MKKNVVRALLCQMDLDPPPADENSWIRARQSAMVLQLRKKNLFC